MTGPSILTVLATAAIGITLLAALVFAALLAYRFSLKRHPYTDCRHCKGTGVRRSRLFAHSFGYCPDCDGHGLKLRAGVHLLNIPLPSQLYTTDDSEGTRHDPRFTRRRPGDRLR
jgi:hypothetical protein